MSARRLALLACVLAGMTTAPAARAGTFELLPNVRVTCEVATSICHPGYFTVDQETSTGVRFKPVTTTEDWTTGLERWAYFDVTSAQYSGWSNVTYTPKADMTANLNETYFQGFFCRWADAGQLCAGAKDVSSTSRTLSLAADSAPDRVRFGLETKASIADHAFGATNFADANKVYWLVTDNEDPKNLAITLGAAGVDTGQATFNRGHLGGSSRLAIALSATDNTITVTKALTDNGQALDAATGLGDGEHTLVLTAADRGGESATLTRTVALDSGLPVSAPLNPAGLHRTATPTFEFQATDPVVEGYATGVVTESASLLVDGFPVAARIVRDGAVFRATPTGALTDGRHTVALSVADAAGNRAADPASHSFDVDTRPPDGDGDGVADSQDRCPAEHAAAADSAPRDGCIDELRSVIEAKWIRSVKTKKTVKLERVLVRFAPAGAKVTLRCVGKKCTFKSRSVTAPASGTVTFKAKRATLPKTAFRIVVTVTKPSYRGNHADIYVKAGLTPARLDARQVTRCLAPGGAAPVSCRA